MGLGFGLGLGLGFGLGIGLGSRKMETCFARLDVTHRWRGSRCELAMRNGSLRTYRRGAAAAAAAGGWAAVAATEGGPGGWVAGPAGARAAPASGAPM